MGLGVLESAGTTHVAGTVLLNDAAAHSSPGTQRLKHGPEGVPEPTTPPSDAMAMKTGGDVIVTAGAGGVYPRAELVFGVVLIGFVSVFAA
jgi:hypothetical protein